MRYRTLTIAVGGALALTGLGGTGFALAQPSDEERPSGASSHHPSSASAKRDDSDRGDGPMHRGQMGARRGEMRRMHETMAKDPAMVRMHASMMRDVDMRRMHDEGMGREG